MHHQCYYSHTTNLPDVCLVLYDGQRYHKKVNITIKVQQIKTQPVD